MRVPIFPADLLARQGFNLIAKKLQRNWPCGTPVTLSSAQEILSKWLGYRDFHDLQQSAKNGNSDVVEPSLDEVRDSISASIFATCQTQHAPRVTDQSLDRLIKRLPLKKLVAFRDDNLSAAAASNNLLRTSEDMPIAGGEIVQGHAEDVSSTDLDTQHPSPSEDIISEDGLRSIWNAVRRKNNLRDECLFKLLLQGCRADVVVAVKRNSISDLVAECCMVQSVVSRKHQMPRTATTAMPRKFLTLVDQYSHQAGLSGDDLLFRSDRDPSVPMSSKELNKLIGSYLRDASIDSALWSAHMIRKSVVVRMRNESRLTMLDIISGLQKKSEHQASGMLGEP